MAPWYQGDTIPVGIGQGYWTATPKCRLQKRPLCWSIKGEVTAPHLLRATIENGHPFDEQVMSDIETYPPLTGVKKKYWDIAQEGMKLANHGKGTARRSFQNMSYVTGKSGTAQVFGLKEDEEYNADEIAEHLLTTHCLLAMHRLKIQRPLSLSFSVWRWFIEWRPSSKRRILDHIILAEDYQSE
ncbi:penicillin-binding transpeptidase domain-containing protein [Vibrio chagasii]|nr:penicillin-binding transpeptidase domain-containing protein [Vibrio chagasii]